MILIVSNKPKKSPACDSGGGCTKNLSQNKRAKLSVPKTLGFEIGLHSTYKNEYLRNT